MAKRKKTAAKAEKLRSRITKRLEREAEECRIESEDSIPEISRPSKEVAVSLPSQSRAQFPQAEEAAAKPAHEILTTKASPWKLLVIEDDPNAIRQIREYFAGHKIEERTIDIEEVREFNSGLGFIREKKVDLVVLDIFRGEAIPNGERAGLRILDDIKVSGFVCVVIYTNLPEALDDQENEFVRLVPKDPGGVQELYAAVESIFKTRIPQMHRAIVNHLDRALCQYMWGFVAAQWTELHQLADRPEFLRILLQRLSVSFAREGVDHAVAEVFGSQAMAKLASDRVHPAEFYVKPPIGVDPALGDIRLRKTNENDQFLAVLWPTCDMVSTGGRSPKTDRVLCAKASRLLESPEAQAYMESRSNTSRAKLEALLTNDRKSNFGFSDRFHFLPGLLDIPDLVVDFQRLEIMPLDDVRKLPSLGVLASPFAEQMGSRFDRYRGRIGTPDLDEDFVIDRIGGNDSRSKS